MNRSARQNGFSLIELVMVIVVISIAAVALLSLFGQVSGSLGVNEQVQTATQLAQEKAEQILADRRNPARGYSWITSANYPVENPVTGFSTYSRSVTITSAASPPCPPGGSCKQVVVTVTQGASVRGQVTLMVASY